MDTHPISRALTVLRDMAMPSGFALAAIWATPLRPAEEHLTKVLPAIETMTTEERSRIRDTVDYFLALDLYSFSIRISSLAVQRTNDSPLLASVLALTLDNDLMDPRDVYVALAVICDASTRTGADAEEIIGRGSHCALPNRAALMNSYLRGPGYMRCLKSMGVELVETPAGPQYIGVR